MNDIVTTIDGERVVLFYGGIFSQWYPCHFTLTDRDGNPFCYNSAEQWMMAEKARMFGDTDRLKAILNTSDPARQKALGKQVQGFEVGRWERDARTIVFRGNFAKFTQNKGLKRQLLATKGATLVEASPTDRIWGIGRGEHEARCLDRRLWDGRNWLGEVITAVRLYLEASGA